MGVGKILVKVTKLPKRDTIYLVPTIKWEQLIQSLQNWLGYLWPWPFTLTFHLEFFRSNCISGMGCPIVTERKGRESVGCPDVKHYGNESTGCCADWGTADLCLWSWIFKVKLYLRNWRPDCHGTTEMGVNRMPWCRRQPVCDLEAEGIVRDRGDLRCRRFRLLILVLCLTQASRHRKINQSIPHHIHS